MEDHRHRQSKELAAPSSDFQDTGASKLSRFEQAAQKPTRRQNKLGIAGNRSSQSDDTAGARVVISVTGQTQGRPQASFTPGQVFSCEYDVQLFPNQTVAAIESSVIWLTQGKGEEDIGVHFFERRNRTSLAADTFNHPQRLSTVLPLSPHSYEGRILKVFWRVRIRIFFTGGKELIHDHPFVLSLDETPRQPPVPPSSTEDDAN
jgi:hypothetical protein